MLLVIGWILLSIGAGAVASAKGRSGFGYFVLAIFLSPLVGFVIAAAMPSLMYVDSVGVRRRLLTESELKWASKAPAKNKGLWVRAAIAILIVIAIAILANQAGNVAP